MAQDNTRLGLCGWRVRGRLRPFHCGPTGAHGKHPAAPQHHTFPLNRKGKGRSLYVKVSPAAWVATVNALCLRFQSRIYECWKRKGKRFVVAPEDKVAESQAREWIIILQQGQPDTDVEPSASWWPSAVRPLLVKSCRGCTSSHCDIMSSHS